MSGRCVEMRVGDAREMRGRYTGDAKEIHGKYMGAREIHGRCKGDTWEKYGRQGESLISEIAISEIAVSPVARDRALEGIPWPCAMKSVA